MSINSPETSERTEDVERTVVGAVELRAGDAGLLRDFYEEALGLEATAVEDGYELADSQGRTLLRLDGSSARGAAPLRRPAAGLFHVAYRYPTRAELAAALDRAMQASPQFQGASDHGVSEAIYLGDPEGNGIELYWDRPFDRWPMEEGKPGMVTEPLDLGSLMANRPQAAAPVVADVGHIHLKVGELEPSAAFYLELVGLDFRQTYPSAAFMAEGIYHHHVAANTWQSRGAAPSAPNEPGLAGFELKLASQQKVDAVAERADRAGVEVTADSGRLTLLDPDGTAVTVMSND